MVPLFVGYALIVWYLAGRHRRRLPGIVAVALGLLGLIAINWFHIQVGHWTRGEIYVPVLQSITYPYTVLVAVVGVFIWSIPRDLGERCGRCGYSLEGLEPSGSSVVCPECGVKHATRAAYRRSGADRRDLSGDDDRGNTHERFAGRSASEQAPHPAHGEDRERQAPDERPAEHAQAAG